ncbi:osmosensing histidine protein kinase Sln1p [Trichomonascus vanleenenianus]|uniref:osmosensing histidine protein kinase Sln1p n=1 Tax=Trichomonascus vanleenenianus TaxID=2268995 RepID=UPI003ECA6FB9
MARQIFVGIKAQLSLVVCIVAFFCLGVLSVATYVSNKGTILDLRRDRLAVIAQLKSAQVQQAIGVLLGQVILMSTRTFIQDSITQSALGTFGLDMNDSLRKLFTLSIESSDDAVAGTIYNTAFDEIYTARSNETLPDEVQIPQGLFPVQIENSSLVQQWTQSVSSHLVGPIGFNNSYYLSLTRRLTETSPSANKGNISQVPQGATIGYLTVVFNAQSLLSIMERQNQFTSDFGLMTLVELADGQLASDITASNDSSVKCQLVFQNASDHVNTSFVATPLMRDLLVNRTSGSVIDYNQPGYHQLSIGYAPCDVLDRQWGALIFQVHAVVYAPLYRLRNLILISLFTIGLGLCIASLLVSSWLVRPIRRLQWATEKANPFLASAKTPVRLWYKPWVKRGRDPDEDEGSDDEYERGGGNDGNDGGDPNSNGTDSNGTEVGVGDEEMGTENNNRGYSTGFWRKRQQGLMKRFKKAFIGSEKNSEFTAAVRQSARDGSHFKIPDKVITTRRVKDELTDLTETFNEMTDELRKQYDTLERRVIERTDEIEHARLVAESANEAKSLFIAKITHELRTPLNGVLGMASVSMAEEDPAQMKESLKVIFKSGELLLHLLTDLLSFSKSNKNNMKLDEKEMMVSEVAMQLKAIFTEQSKKNQIDLTIDIESEVLENCVVIGDINRILQIVINLMSNSLKFTPRGGSVKCLVSGFITPADPSNADAEYISSGEGSSVFTKHTMSTKNSFTNSDRTHSGDGIKTMEQKSKESISTDNSHDDHHHHTADEDEFSHRLVELTEDGNPVIPLSYRRHDVLTVVFDVSDTGPGIAPHLQDKVFEPFVQGDLQFSERRVGAGLGLSICRQLAGLMHGTVGMQSDLGKGSTFTFRVPLRIVGDRSAYHFSDLSAIEDWPEYENYASTPVEEVTDPNLQYLNVNQPHSPPKSLDASEKPMRPPISRNPSSRGSRNDEESKRFNSYRVLVAEDNKVNQEVMIRMLKLEGIENVTIANDGEEAVARVADSPHFDIIFMDVQMPNLDGRQATEIIRTKHGYTGPIVAVSAFADSSNVEKCIDVGMNEFLAKPLRRPHLHKLLSNLFHSSDESTATAMAAGSSPLTTTTTTAIPENR